MNEAEVRYKRIFPFIREKLGYDDENIAIEKHIRVGRGSSFYVDMAVYTDFGKTIAFVLDIKKQNTYLPHYKDQVISYGLLLRSSLSVLSDGSEIIIYDTKTQCELYSGDLRGAIPFLSKAILLARVNPIDTLSKDEESKAKNVLQTFQKREKFVWLLCVCENIIRDIDGKTGEESFNELSKILFIKIFSERENMGYIFSNQGKVGVQTIFSRSKEKYPDLFENDKEILLSDRAVEKLIEALKDYSFTDTDIDIKGRAFEIFIGNTLTGKLGQFFTPRTVVRFVLDFVAPRYELPGNKFTKIIDPSCGSGGFLIDALQRLFVEIENKEGQEEVQYKKSRLVQEQIYGIDVSPSLIRTSKMNMVLHGDGQGGIIRDNGLIPSREFWDRHKNSFDYIYTNPPFGNRDSDPAVLKNYTISGGKNIEREILFLEQYFNFLKPGGMLSVVLPNGILNNYEKKYKKVRAFIKNNFNIIGIVGLPDRSFKSSGANSHTTLLFAQKKYLSNIAQENVFIAIANEIGFERRTKFAFPINKNDFNRIIKNYRDYKSGVHHFYSLASSLRLDAYNLVLPPGLIEDRLDANYYYAKYLVDVGDDPQQLSDVCRVSKAKITNTDKMYRYVQFSDISAKTGEIISYTQEGYPDELPTRAKMAIREHDIICARLFDSEDNIALVSKEFDGQVCSTGFVVLHPLEGIPPELLYYYMRLSSTRQQVRYLCRGTILPSCRDSDILQIKIPKITDKLKIQKIVMAVQEIEKGRQTIRKKLNELSAI